MAGGSRTGCGPSGGWAGGVCVSVAARGREAMAPPPPAARSAARGPPGRAHCSRPESTGLARRPESFRGSAPAPPSACGGRGLEGGSGAVVELTPGLTRGAQRLAPWGWGGAPRADNPPSFGTWHRVGSLRGPTFLESRRLPRSICCYLREPWAHPGGGVGGGGHSVLLAAPCFDPGMYLPKSLVPSLPVGPPALVLV